MAKRNIRDRTAGVHDVPAPVPHFDAPAQTILYVNFNVCAASGMFRRRLDGIRRYATSRGIEVSTLGRSDCAVEEVPEALARL